MIKFLKILHPRFWPPLLILPIIFTAVTVKSSHAQVPPRFYGKTLNGTNDAPLLNMSLESNANPADPSHKVYPGSIIEATMMIPGYAKIFELFDRAALAAVTFPMGRVSGDVTVGGKSFHQSVHGFGDPMFEFGINVIGKDPIRNIPDMLRYEPGLSIDIIGDIIFPIGEYDDDQPLNIGQNRWTGRIGAPIILQLGQWIPGQHRPHLGPQQRASRGLFGPRGRGP